MCLKCAVSTGIVTWSPPIVQLITHHGAETAGENLNDAVFRSLTQFPNFRLRVLNLRRTAQASIVSMHYDVLMDMPQAALAGDGSYLRLNAAGQPGAIWQPGQCRAVSVTTGSWKLMQFLTQRSGWVATWQAHVNGENINIPVTSDGDLLISQEHLLLRSGAVLQPQDNLPIQWTEGMLEYTSSNDAVPLLFPIRDTLVGIVGTYDPTQPTQTVIVRVRAPEASPLFNLPFITRSPARRSRIEIEDMSWTYGYFYATVSTGSVYQQPVR
jgi:hypothetical protein